MNLSTSARPAASLTDFIIQTRLRHNGAAESEGGGGGGGGGGTSQVCVCAGCARACVLYVSLTGVCDVLPALLAA